MAIAEELFLSIYKYTDTLAFATSLHITEWIPPSNKPYSFRMELVCRLKTRFSHFGTKHKFISVRERLDAPQILCHAPYALTYQRYSNAAEQPILVIAQLDVVITSSLIAHSYENPLLSENIED